MPRKESNQLEDLGRKLNDATGPKYWRSLEELAANPEFTSYLHREFPESASQWDERADRRDFLRLMAASLALGGLAGCKTKTAEKVLPYVRQPEQIVPGKPLYFATSAPVDGYGVGVLVESHMGRPTKIEGNPDHPASLGATSAQMQASVLELYDPDRSRTVSSRRQIQTWDTFLTTLKPKLDALRDKGGEGLRLLIRDTTSPTLIGQLQSLLQTNPQTKIHLGDSFESRNEERGCEIAFGRRLRPVYDFRRADVVLSLSADFISTGPGQVRYAREFSDRRSVAGYRNGDTAQRMSRVYAVEPTPSLVGAKADHRLPLRADQIVLFAKAVASRLGVPGITDPGVATVPADWLNAVVTDLQNYRNSDDGGCLVVAGPWQPPAVHAIAHAINAHLGAIGTTVRYCTPFVASEMLDAGSIEQLIADMQQGQVEMLVIMESNPIYDSPRSGEFGKALSQVNTKIHFGHYQDETSFGCDWHIPALHYLESWGDFRAYDGSASIQQPLISPLFSGRSVHELVAALQGTIGQSTLELVKGHWAVKSEDQDSEDRWQTWLHNGVIPDSAAATESVQLVDDFVSQLNEQQSVSTESLQVVFRPDPNIHDGRFANNGWLQELPKPFTKLTWDNAALVSPATAKRLDLKSEAVVQLETDHGQVDMPVWILPGQADNVVTLHLGYGRTRVGHVGNGVGRNVNSLRVSNASWSLPVRLKLSDDTEQLASTQHHFLLDGRELIRSGTIEQWRADPDHPDFAHAHHHVGDASLLPEVAYDGYKWGMVIDLNTCTGCNACVIACQAENNIPVVGKEQVANGREMHWLRLDTYFAGALDNPTTHFQPLPCMHCEKAPCEIVCPVAATTHSPSGINEMTYNRCVGTRYCANNCPYKVRRFNFLHYNEHVEETPLLQMVQNPDVTVRGRGVMEKCTYCVQRVNAARIDAEKENRSIRDGEVVAACQAACPSQAIQFGDLNDSSSVVAEAHRSPLRYSLLEELNTQPRTTYLAEVRNPHRDLTMTQEVGDHG